MDKISVIIPVYNVRNYLSRCLDSLIAQTYGNLEIICVDDGSDDGSGEVLDQYTRRDNRIRVIHSSNQGVSSARNLALDHMTGEFVGFVDADDYIEPDMYETLYRKIKDTGADIVSCGFFEDIDGKPVQVRNVEEVPEKVIHTREFLKYIYIRDRYRGVSGYLWTRLFKADIFREDGDKAAIRFDTDLNISEDVELLARCCMKTVTMSYINKPLYHYVKRSGSAMNTYEKRLETLSSCRAYEKVIRLFESEGIDQEIIDYVKRFYVYHSSLLVLPAYRLKLKDKGLQLKNNIKSNLNIYLKTNKGHLNRKIRIFMLLYLTGLASIVYKK